MLGVVNDKKDPTGKLKLFIFKNSAIINEAMKDRDDYNDFLQAIKDFIVENEGIINKYVDWLDLNNDEDEIIEKLNNLIQQIKEEN